MGTCADCGKEVARKLRRERCARCYKRFLKAAKADGTFEPIKSGTPLAERLQGKAAAGPNGCLLWTGYVGPNGYGYISDGVRKLTTHRASYEIRYGKVAEGLVLDHVCHNRDESCPGGPSCVHRRCINPLHLEAVPQKVNVHRSHKSPSALQARQTHCKNGHPFDEANTYRPPEGGRVCRECRRRRRPPMEIPNPCGYVSESGKACTRPVGHEGRHFHDARRK